jgi:glycerol-3-phosphate cytidylyltransferase-like family protein
MSGVAGGNRIKREDVQATFNDYIKLVLRKIPGFINATLSGSIKTGAKADFGDLDIIVSFEGNNKQEVKQLIIDSVTSLPSSIIVPFKSPKYTGRRYYNSGELISVLFPITGKPGEYIQVDNIIALSEEEHNFKNMFLDLPAEKQGLLIGLVKTVLLEEEPKNVFRRLGITHLPSLEEGEEYEFNLSSVNLSLRKVKLDNFKEISREIIWTSADWNLVKKLLQNYNIDTSFENLLNEISTKLKNPRSKKRVAGIFRGMVSVKSGEVSTPKGDNKERAIKLVTQRLSESKVKPLFTKNTSFSRFFAESEGVNFNLIVIFAGRFQPFHRGHALYYEKAKHEFPTAKFYIATASNTSKDALKEPSKYPFDFNEKKQIIHACGVPLNEIIETRIPYKPVEILEHYNSSVDKVIFLVGLKDMKNDPRFSFKNTKNGDKSYFQPYKDINQMEPFNENGGHGYIYAPGNIIFDIDGQRMQSASEFRDIFRIADEKKRKRMVMETIGHFDKNIYNIFVNKLGK